MRRTIRLDPTSNAAGSRKNCCGVLVVSGMCQNGEEMTTFQIGKGSMIQWVTRFVTGALQVGIGIEIAANSAS